MILIPINLGNTHWILAKIGIKDRRVTIYDSMLGHNTEVGITLSKWAAATFPDVATPTPTAPFPAWQWAIETVEDQENGWDCAIHMMVHTATTALKLSAPPDRVGTETQIPD